MNKSGYNIPLLLYSVVKKHIPAWTKKLDKRKRPVSSSKKVSNQKRAKEI
jgi:hypothetical protein